MFERDNEKKKSPSMYRAAAWMLSAALAVTYMPLSVMAGDEMQGDMQAASFEQMSGTGIRAGAASGEHGDIIGTGELGENLSFAVYEDGLLKVEGSGETYGYGGDEPLTEYASAITSVELPDGLTKVNQYAFAELVNVKGTLVIPDSVTFIGQCGFYKIGASKVVFGDGLRELGWLAFGSCENLEEINVPKNLEKISTSAFDSDHRLDTITSVPDTAEYKAVDNVIFTNDMKELTLYPAGLTAKTYTVPEGVEKIVGMGGNRNLTKVKFGNGVREICDSAMGSMYNLRDVEVPDTLEKIGNDGFIYCRQLRSLDLPAGMKTINNDAFYGCSELESISILSRDCRFSLIGAPKTTVIYGRKGSTAEDYAKSKGHEFREIESGEVLSDARGNRALMESLETEGFEAGVPLAENLATNGYPGNEGFFGYQASDSFLWSDAPAACKRSIKAKTEELCRGRSTDLAKAEAIFNYLRKIYKNGGEQSIESAWEGEGAGNNVYTELMSAMLMYADIPSGIAFTKNVWGVNALLCDGEWILADVNHGLFNDPEAVNDIRVVMVRSGKLVFAADDLNGFKLDQVGVYPDEDLEKDIRENGIDIPDWISGYYYSWEYSYPDIEIRGTKGTVAEDIVREIGYEDIRYSGNSFTANRYKKQSGHTGGAADTEKAKADVEAAQKALDEARARWDNEKASAAKDVEDAQKVMDNIGVSFMDEKAGRGFTSSDWYAWLKANMKNKSFGSVAWNSYLASEDFDKAFYDPLSYDNLMKAAELAAEGNKLRKSQDPDLAELKINYRMMMVSAASNSMSSKVVGHVLYNDPDFKAAAIYTDSKGGSSGENISWGAEDPYMGWYYEEKIHWLADQKGVNKANITSAMLTQVENEAKANGHDFIAYYRLYHGSRDDYLADLNEERSTSTDKSKKYSTGHYTNIIRSSWKSVGMAYNTEGAIYNGICHTGNFASGAGDVTPEQFRTELSAYAASARKALNEAGARAEQLRFKPSYVTDAEEALAKAKEAYERLVSGTDSENDGQENDNRTAPSDQPVTDSGNAASGTGAGNATSNGQSGTDSRDPAPAVQKEKTDLPGTSVKKPKALKKAVTVRWKKIPKRNRRKIKGVEIQISKDAGFRNIVKTAVCGSYRTSKRISGLRSGKKYYIRVRTYKVIKGQKHVSGWSAVRSLKVK